MHLQIDLAMVRTRLKSARAREWTIASPYLSLACPRHAYMSACSRAFFHVPTWRSLTLSLPFVQTNISLILFRTVLPLPPTFFAVR